MRLKCGRHGESDLIYVVCLHVLKESRSVEHYAESAGLSAEDVGEILCASCDAVAAQSGSLSKLFSLKKLALICGRCADLIMQNRNVPSLEGPDCTARGSGQVS